MKRYAILRNADAGGALVTDHRARVEALLPSNYRVIHEAFEQRHVFSATAPTGGVRTAERIVFVIEGEDNAGWNMDDYVLPRLASGLIIGEEIDLSHPIMKSIPA